MAAKRPIKYHYGSGRPRIHHKAKPIRYFRANYMSSRLPANLPVYPVEFGYPRYGSQSIRLAGSVKGFKSKGRRA